MTKLIYQLKLKILRGFVIIKKNLNILNENTIHILATAPLLSKRQINRLKPSSVSYLKINSLKTIPGSFFNGEID